MRVKPIRRLLVVPETTATFTRFELSAHDSLNYFKIAEAFMCPLVQRPPRRSWVIPFINRFYSHSTHGLVLSHNTSGQLSGPGERAGRVWGVYYGFTALGEILPPAALLHPLG
jgi:hypothetical protein